MSHENKTSLKLSEQRKLPFHPNKQLALYPMRLSKSHQFCLCSPMAALRFMKDENPLRCDDMPWRCPFDEIKITPTL